MQIDNIIQQAASRALKALYGLEADPQSIQVSATKKEFEGNLTIVVFPYLKASRKAPEATATEIGEWMVANEPAVSAFNAVKGFLNLSVSPDFWPVRWPR